MKKVIGVVLVVGLGVGAGVGLWQGTRAEGVGVSVTVGQPETVMRLAEAVEEFSYQVLWQQKWAWMLGELMQRSELVREENALRDYMTQARFVPGVIDLAGVMVAEAHEHGIDSRICPVTAYAESSGGRGSSNLFGCISGNSAPWDEQVRWYFQRLQEIAGAHGWAGSDVWHLAWFWYGGGSSMGGRAESYAGNVTASVNTIGW